MARTPLFADRADAGRRLAAALGPVQDDAVVAALARGGVPVGAEVARALGVPLDVMTVRKVGHPAQPEFALGAVSETGVVDPPDLPAQLAEPELARAREQATRLRSGRAAIDLRGRTAIVVDDGLATGHTMAAALESADAAGAARVVMAVPVAAGPGFRELAARFEAFALEVVEPPAFFAVGQFYADFEQVPDEAVVALLAA